MANKGKGWYRESRRHALAARGVKTKREVKTEQYRFDPDAIQSKEPITTCTSCGRKYTKRNFSDDCPACRHVDKIIREEWFDEKPKKYKQQTLQSEVEKYFSITDTGTSLNDVLKNPDYQLREKHRIGKVVYMTPSEYRQKCRETYGKGAHKFTEDWKLERLRKYIASGNKMPLPILDYWRGNDAQEGWHRSIIADELGLKKMPVLVVRDATDEEWLSFMRKNYPERLKYYGKG